GRMASSVPAGAFGMAIDWSGDWVRLRLTGSGGRGLPLPTRVRSNARYDRTSSRVLTTVCSASPSRQARRRDRGVCFAGRYREGPRHLPSRLRWGSASPRSSHPAASRPTNPEDPVSGWLLAALPSYWFPRSLGLDPRMRQRHAAEVMPVVEIA